MARLATIAAEPEGEFLTIESAQLVDLAEPLKHEIALALNELVSLVQDLDVQGWVLTLRIAPTRNGSIVYLVSEKNSDKPSRVAAGLVAPILRHRGRPTPPVREATKSNASLAQ